MTSISGISAIPSHYRVATQNCWQQRTSGLEALENALQSGNLRAARQAFATLVQDSSGTASASNASSENSQASGAFQALESALLSGNLSAARQALATLQLECGE
jgi:hypothetical protein